jgi:hypothetical protein
MTPAPSVTEWLSTTALPPAMRRDVQPCELQNRREARTAHDLINDLLCRILVEVVYHYVRAARGIRERVPVQTQAVEGISLRVAYSVDARLSETTACASDHDGVSSE